MQIVIDIDENVFTRLFDNGKTNAVDMLRACVAIRNGTPLPKGHGRLKDIDAFITKVNADRKHSAYLRSWTADDVLNALDNNYALTIIDTDTEESDADND